MTLEIKPGRKIFFPTNDLRQTADAIISLLNHTVDEEGKKFPMPKYVTREYVLELIASIINGLITNGEGQVNKDNFEKVIRGMQ